MALSQSDPQAKPTLISRLSQHRLNSSAMYRAVYQSGTLLKSEHLRLRFCRAPQDDSISRVGFLIRKKSGKAVLRNAIRRRFRRVFQMNHSKWVEPNWVVFDLPPQPVKCVLSVLVHEAEYLLGQVSS